MNELTGLDYMVKLSIKESAGYALPREQKRSLLFSLYSFRCLFDNAMMFAPMPELVEYGCCFIIDKKEHPDYSAHRDEFDGLKDGEVSDYGGVCINVGSEENPEYKIKFDAGSDLFIRLVRDKKITGENAAYPEKCTLFEMAYLVISNTLDENLKALWYIFFPYIIFAGAPFEQDIFTELLRNLIDEELFAAVLESRYSAVICDSNQEMAARGYPAEVLTWYLPYVDWKNERTDDGRTREAAKYARELAKQNYDLVLEGTGRLLDTFPDDEELLLLNISARVSKAGTMEMKKRAPLLSENLALIADAVPVAKDRLNYFIYYRGLSLLGLGDVDGAKADFESCLETDPDFELAKLMLKALTTPPSDAS